MTLKSFLKEEYLASSISKGFLGFTLFSPSAVPETSKNACFFLFLQRQIQSLLQLPLCSIAATYSGLARAI